MMVLAALMAKSVTNCPHLDTNLVPIQLPKAFYTSSSLEISIGIANSSIVY